MIEIVIFMAKSGIPVRSYCVSCKKIVGDKACVSIKDHKGRVVWVCQDCVKITDFTLGKFPCSK